MLNLRSIFFLISSIIQSQRLKLPPILIIFNQNVHASLTFSGFLRNQIVQSNKKLFRERDREREGTSMGKKKELLVRKLGFWRERERDKSCGCA